MSPSSLVFVLVLFFSDSSIDLVHVIVKRPVNCFDIVVPMT